MKILSKTHTWPQNLQNRVFETSQSVENLCCILSVGCEENFFWDNGSGEARRKLFEDACVCVCVCVWLLHVLLGVEKDSLSVRDSWLQMQQFLELLPRNTFYAQFHGYLCKASDKKVCPQILLCISCLGFRTVGWGLLIKSCCQILFWNTCTHENYLL